MSANPYTLQAGSNIENYQVHRVLGVGGFGITYQAHDKNLDCPVAIKEYFPHGLAVRDKNGTSVMARSRSEMETYSYGLKRFMDEARVLARFKDPNIVRVSRYMEKNGTGYIIMDYEEGVPLSRYLSKCKRLSEDELRNVFLPVLHGLDTIHQEDFLHRDVKPPNIYLRKNGPPVLLDFGAARQALGSHSHTVTNFGTHGYAPIEQFTTQDKQGPWSDIYGVGATMYHCITGRAPATAMDRISELQGGRKDPNPPASVVGNGKYSQSILNCVDIMLSVRSEDRPATVSEVIPVLEDNGDIQTSNFDNSYQETLVANKNESSTILVDKEIDWDSEIIEQAEKHLTNYLGPLAKLVVKNAMHTSSSADELFEVISEQIDSNAEREEFLRTVGGNTSRSSRSSGGRHSQRSSGGHSLSKGGSGRRVDNFIISKLEEQLSAHIGPLAQMLVKQAVESNKDLDDIIDILSDEISSEKEREKFRVKFRY